MEPLVWQGIMQVPADKWKSYVEHVLKQNDAMRKLDHINNVVDQGPAVAINLDDSTTSNADLSCEEDEM